MILVDYSPVLIASAHSATAAWEKSGGVDASGRPMKLEEIHLFRMLNTLRSVNVAYRAKYGRMVLCVDRKPYWRSGVFPNYKKNRKPMDRTMEWNRFFDNGDGVLEACKNVFGWKVIDIVGLEGDDIIGTIAQRVQDEPHMIISPDGDFKQLQIYPNVHQYDVIRKRKIVEKRPEAWLRLKLITGDKKDGIPNIVSDIDTFITEGVQQTPIKSVDKRNWSNAKSPLFFCDGPMLERYEMNERLLDMRKVPEELQEKIMAKVDEGAKAPGNLYGYFATNGISRFIDSLSDFK